MALQFWFGASGVGKSHKLYEEILDRATKEPQTNFLVIVPDQFTMQTQWDLVTKSQGKGIFNIDVLSFGRLTHRIFEEVGARNLPVLDDTGKSLVLRLVAAEIADELPELGRKMDKIGYVHEVKSAISEFMQYGVSVDTLRSVTEQSAGRNVLRNKLSDLTTLYEHFQNYIRDHFLTTEETLDRLCHVLPKSRIIPKSVICFDGFTGFTPIQNRVIIELVRYSRQVILTQLMDEKEDPHTLLPEQKLFYLSSKTVTSLERLLKQEELAILPDRWINREEGRARRFEKSAELAHMERYLFRFPSVKYTQQTKQIHMFQASTPREEVHQTCIQIARLVREEGYRYRDIAVIMGDVAGYAGYVEELFTRFSFPFFLDQTRAVMLNPFIELIRAALMLSEKNFSYEAVFHYLRCGLTGFSREEVDVLENYVLAHDIRGKSKYERLFVYRDKDEEEAGERLDRVNGIRERFMEEIAPLLTECETVREHAEALYAFLVRGDIQQKLVWYEQDFEKKGMPEKAKEYGQIYRLVMDLLDQIVGLLAEEKMDRKTFYEILNAGFGEISVGVIPQSVDHIVVGDMERTRLKPIRVLFFLGINDGNIPRSASGGGILSDIDREYLAGLEADMELAPTPRKQMFIQKLYLYMNMTKPSEKLYLSYAKVGADGKSLRPAYLIGTMQKMFEDLEILTPEQAGWEEQLLCREDGYDLLATKLREYVLDKENTNVEVLASIYGAKDSDQTFGILEKAAFQIYQDAKLSKRTARMLYGELLQNSVSRLEKFAACEYAHFLQYGMQLEEREEYTFEAADLGTIFHGILEIFGNKITQHHSTWMTFTKEQAQTWIKEAIEEFAIGYGETILFSSHRRQYVLTRMERVMNRTVMTLQYQLQKGVFEPKHFELSFSHIEDLSRVDATLTENERMRLVGRIDRVDTYEDEEHVYVKVMDYKSGSKSVDLAAVYYGLQLQLVVYLNAAMENERQKNGQKEIIPAGILYYRMADPIVEERGDDVEEIHRQIQSELRAVGLVNDDESVLRLMDKESTGKSDVIPVEWKTNGDLSARSQAVSAEQLKKLSDYVNRKIGEIGSEIYHGRIRHNPYELGTAKACTYCSFKNVCGFDRQIPGMKMRELEKLSEEEIFARIEKEEA